MLTVNTDPNCPGAGRAEKDYNLGRDRTHYDKFRCSYSHISKEHWNSIFGVTLKLDEPGEAWSAETMRKAFDRANGR